MITPQPKRVAHDPIILAVLASITNDRDCMVCQLRLAISCFNTAIFDFAKHAVRRLVDARCNWTTLQCDYDLVGPIEVRINAGTSIELNTPDDSTSWRTEHGGTN